MTSRSVKKLKRLARLTELIYRREAVDAAKIAQSQQALVAGAENTLAFLDEADAHPSFVRELALARTARLREEAEASAKELATQLTVAIQALARFKGVQTLVESSVEENARGEAQRSLEEAIGCAGARSANRLEQGTGTTSR
jgi:hypothetical protein